MKSILILAFAAVCSASLPRGNIDFESGDIYKRGPSNYDQATDADIAAYLKRALAESQQLNSYLKNLDDMEDDDFDAEVGTALIYNFLDMDDEFDDNLNDELLLQEIENYDNLIHASNIQQQLDSMIHQQPVKETLQKRQLSIFESFGINGSAPVDKIQEPKMAYKNTASKPAFSSIKPSIAYEPKAVHDVDVEEFKTWIYPINYPLRDYQFNIVQKALFTNTLVALPTGLGKTFIASVVMYNYYRWFPNGKLVFMAPTKPLVNQQIEACYKITGLPKEMTEELTGSVSPEARRLAWKMKRVFFITPQILQNDLNTNVCTSEDIVLLVFDEAHRASKNYAYCELIKSLISKQASFRVLALTATPGSDITAVANVVQNLIITRIEVRTEDSIDISKYIHTRALELIVVPISEDIKKLTELYCNLMNIFLKKLNDQHVYRETNPLNASNFAILKAREAFRRNAHASNRPPQLKGYIEGIFGVAQTLAIAYTNLVQHGINLFYSSLSKYDKNRISSKLSKAGTDLASNSQFIYMMNLIREMKTKPDFLSHLKMEKLMNVILDHFSLKSDDEDISNSRVIIFTQYRESVEEIVSLLNRHAILQVMSFVGQSTGNKGTKGLSQKEQLEVIRKFKAGNYNVLVCTSIGEEGLDIGEIDLIVCYDSQNSPIRMLQRMGRTGRKRKGKVVLLLTQGREEEAYNKAQYQYKTVQNAIVTQQGNKIIMFAPSYDVIPKTHPRPECQKLVMNISESPSKIVPKRKRNSGTEQSSIQDIYLNANEMLKYQSEFQVPSGNSSELVLGRYSYRNITPLPNLHLERSERALGFTALMADLEGLVAKEEEELMKKSARERKYHIQNIGQYESSSPLCIDIERTLKFRSKEMLLESDFALSPLPIRSIAKAVTIDNTAEMDSVHDECDIQSTKMLEKCAAGPFYICSDSTLSPLPLKRIAESINTDDVSDINFSDKCKDLDIHLTSDQHIVQSPLINHQDDLNKILDIDPDEWMKPDEDLISQKLSDPFNDLDQKQMGDLLQDANCDSLFSRTTQTPIIKARKKKMIILDASSSAKSGNFVKPAPIITKSKNKRPTQPNEGKKKRKLDYSNPYFDLEAGLSDNSLQSNEDEDSNIDLDRNLSGLIAESPIIESQEINYYRKSLLSPELGGLGTKKHAFRFATPKKYEPCTQVMPDSDTPGSLANFVVDDESFFNEEPDMF